MRRTAPWHYVDVPLDEPRYDSKFSGEKIGCVVDKINEFRLVINDKSRSVEDRRFALRFLIHCVEDMHQPCHVWDNHDKGWNQTRFRKTSGYMGSRHCDEGASGKGRQGRLAGMHEPYVHAKILP
jgi:hypothetical protein